MMAVADRMKSHLDPFLQQAAEEIFPVAVVHIFQNDDTIYRQAVGWLDPETRATAPGPETLFDLASLTKLVTVTSFLRLVAAGKVGLDEPVAGVLPSFGDERPIRPYEDPLRPGHYITVNGE